jgi:hypothetical protein
MHNTNSPSPPRQGRPRRARDQYVSAEIVLGTFDVSRAELRALAAGPCPVVRSRRCGGTVAYNWGDVLIVAVMSDRGVKT